VGKGLLSWNQCGCCESYGIQFKDRIVMGAESKSRFIDDEVKKMTAYHEGGHALVALYTQGAMPLHKVTCVPRGHALGVVGPS
jgi:ATP-dependent Zn protease